MKRRTFCKTSLLGSILFPYSLKILNVIESKHFTFNIGRIKCTIILDYVYNYLPKDFFSNIEETRILDRLRGYKTRNGFIPSPFNLMLLEYDSKLVLIDTGIGYADKPYKINGKDYIWKGELNSILDSINKSREQVTDIIITHFHPDHLGGNKLQTQRIRQTTF